MQEQTKAAPFLRWVGGKRQLLDQLLPMVPRTFKAYHEPFMGGAAMFFALGPSDAMLSDANPELVRCFCGVRDAPSVLIVKLAKARIDEKTYLKVRDQSWHAMSNVDIAARMIYLNKTCFNGLYRVNLAGKFNVSWGKWAEDKLPTLCDPGNILACSSAMAHTIIRCADFGSSLGACAEGDFAYLDPPYMPVSKTSDFTSYTPRGFGIHDLQRLHTVCLQLSFRGVRFLLSEAGHPTVRQIFSGFRITDVQARRSVNCDGAKRGRVGEVVIRNYDDKGNVLVPKGRQVTL